MHDKNDRLAKENTNLKSIISQRMKTQEELLKRSIKAEYNQILTYRQMLEVLEKSIESLEEALEQCKRIQQTVVKNRKFLVDKTNHQNQEDYKGIKDIIGENEIGENSIIDEKSTKIERDKRKTLNIHLENSNINNMNKNIPVDSNSDTPLPKKKKELFSEKDIDIFNCKKRRDKKGSSVKEDLFDSWERNELK